MFEGQGGLVGGQSLQVSVVVLVHDGSGVSGVFGVLGVAEVDDLLEPLGDSLGAEGVVESDSGGLLPTEGTEPSSTHFVDSSVAGVIGVAQEDYERDDVVDRGSSQQLLGEDSLGHVGGSHWGDSVGEDVLGLTFSGDGLAESQDSQLGGGVVGLSEVTVET